VIEIRLVKHSEEKGRLTDLFRASFGRSMPAEYWDWKYTQNPFASADPEVIVAIEDGKIVGARPYRLAEIWLGNEKVRAAQHGDTMVHPEHQRKGIFSQMGQFAIKYLKENGYGLSYGFANAKSRPGFLRQGYRIVAPVEVMVRAVHPQKLISHKLGNKVLGTGLGFLYDRFLNTKLTEPVQPSAPFRIEVFDQFSDELKEIDALRDPSLIELVRSESYLRWLFDQRPNRSYKYIMAKREETLWGYVVINAEKERNGLVYGYIVDYQIKNRDVACSQTLMYRALNELGKSGCDFIIMWVLGEPVLRKQLLKHFGFKSALLFPYNRFFGHGYLDAIRIDDRAGQGIDIYAGENWRVTYAYADAMGAVQVAGRDG
jgi:GNAT superfamily N-acetyltransferase